MPRSEKGDFDWAVNSVVNDVGESFLQDNFGLIQLHMALYEGGSLSPDLQAVSYHNFIDYMIDNYDYDFEDEFDWDAYREWYDSQ